MERRLAAILAADVVGYSRLMGSNEVGTLSALKAHRNELVDGKIAEHQGRIVKLTGDGMLVEFGSVVNAVECAVKIQREMRLRNADVPGDRRIEFRIGINLGDIIFEDNDIYGDGVNIAARIESIAKPGGIAVSAVVRDNVNNRLDLAFEDTGEQTLKNIERPVRVFNVYLGAPQPGAAASAAQAAAKSATPVVPERQSIAVLPFTNMSGDSEQEYFADGITEDIITDLSKIMGLSVIARNSVFTYKGKPIKVQQAAQELGVKYILEGSVRRAGQRVRITGQLINGTDGLHLWAERYDRDLTDIFAIQDEITRTIVDQLRVRLLPEEKKAIEQAPTGNVEAYSYYLKGREFRHRFLKSNLLRAKQMFAKAIELDPLFARAYVGIAICDSLLRFRGDTSIRFDDILRTAVKALEIDPSLAEAHAARGFALLVADRRQDAASAFQRALTLDPNCHEANQFYGDFSVTGGDLETAMKHYTRALEINPEDYHSVFQLMSILKSLGRRDESEKYARLGIKRTEEALRRVPEDSTPAQLTAVALAALGERDKAMEWLARAQAIDPDDWVIRYNAACTYAQLGEADRAIDLLENCLQGVGNDFKRWFKNDSDLDSIRAHPRYQKLLELAE
ncbi:tetratricopeptide repeat protein [Mesorhizobium sp.]|uniref:TPR end-of-group domain-containing protein n=1 Tax=Mesorhizobium sp. TaxID=1871066 RepID=UPI000FE607AA|nr:tetratricopeptide repeat protein [Mesorhizobium sp.]RWA70592.1 MAG: tetratricopeptide repeat protein [Mesorhizobium sp.]RWA83562.1 MAG: tetratricopeptide repeat protein [Mesorhizobium sp.]